jgi:hypothetical protein
MNGIEPELIFGEVTAAYFKEAVVVYFLVDYDALQYNQFVKLSNPS